MTIVKLIYVNKRKESNMANKAARSINGQKKEISI